MSTVVIDGAASPLGALLVGLVSRSGDGDSVVAANPSSIDTLSASFGPDTDLIVLAPLAGPEVDGSTTGGVDLDGASRLLAAADGHGLRQLVVLSSAMVYGAWANNPVPLTEEAVLRPNPGCPYAADKAELERRVGEWGAANPSTKVAILRPTVTVSGDPAAVDWLERSLWRHATARHGEAEPHGQFLHLDDLAAAAHHVRIRGLDGVFNVAPDGWLSSARQIELSGPGTAVRVPSKVARPFVGLRWRWGLTSTPPEILDYTMHDWVIANDRLRSTGWEPQLTNEESYVTGNRAGWWAQLNGRRRQEAALGALVAAIVAVVTGVVVAVRRMGRRG